MSALTAVPAGSITSGYPATTCRADGDAAGRLANADNFSLWVIDAWLEAGTTLSWAGDQRDEAVYVLEGQLSTDSVAIPPKGCVSIEAGAAASVCAQAPTHVLHFGSSTSHQTSGEAPRVHTIPLEASHRVAYGPDPGAPDFEQHYYLDGTCQGCRLALFHIRGRAAQNAGSHYHTQDEIIRVLEGELQVGRVKAPTGTSLFVPANLRYGFRTRGPFAFLNYRDNVSKIYTDTSGIGRYETVSGSGNELHAEA
jgi:hypothetical protein